jgi:hypothetical protein
MLNRFFSLIAISVFALSVISIGGCATDPYAQMRQQQAAAAEQQRRANLTPRQRCMEDADKQENSCGLQCVLGNFQNANARNACNATCKQMQMQTYQMCSMR